MDENGEALIAKYEEEASYLSRLHATILFWLNRGFTKDTIGTDIHKLGLIDKVWREDRVQEEITEILKDMGVPEMAPRSKGVYINKYILPAIANITNDDPEELKKFPLRVREKPVDNKIVDKPPKEKLDKKVGKTVDKPVDNRRRQWLIPLGIAVFLGLLYGAFSLGQNQTPEPTPTLQVTTLPLPSQTQVFTAIPATEMPIILTNTPSSTCRCDG